MFILKKYIPNGKSVLKIRLVEKYLHSPKGDNILQQSTINVS